jgi:hypothetical protein
MMPTATSTPSATPSLTKLKVNYSDLPRIQPYLDSRQLADRLFAALPIEQENIRTAEDKAAATYAAEEARLTADAVAEEEGLRTAAKNAEKEAQVAAADAVEKEALRHEEEKTLRAEKDAAEDEALRAEGNAKYANGKQQEAYFDYCKITDFSVATQDDRTEYMAPIWAETERTEKVAKEKRQAAFAASRAIVQVQAAKAQIESAAIKAQQAATTAAQAIGVAKAAQEKAAKARSEARAKAQAHAKGAADALTQEAAKGKAQADEELAALSDSIRNLSRERLQALTQLAAWEPGDPAPKGWSIALPVGEPPRPTSTFTKAAIIRGELPYSAQPTDSDGTRTDDAGWWVSDFRHRALAMDIEVMLDQFSPDPMIVSRDNYDPSYVEAVVEPEFNKPNQSLAAIQPYPPSPVPSQKQAELIEVVRNLPLLRTWFLTGPRPGGASKTALASAYIKDLITLRLAEVQDKLGVRPDFNLCVYRIHAGKWMHEMARWMTHDLKDDSARPPKVNPEAITEAYQSMAQPMGWKIVCLIDDLDKFDPNVKRNGWLHGIVDAITEKNGMIITTANKTVDELTRMGFDPATLSRLDGSRFLAEERLVMDFHRYARR